MSYEFELNQIITDEDLDAYAKAAEWCNNNGAFIEEIDHEEDSPRRFQIKAVPAESDEQLKTRVRTVRDSYLQATDFTQLADAPVTSTQKAKYKQYRTYLRDYPDSSEDWFEHEPMSFAEWSTSQTTA